VLGQADLDEDQHVGANLEFECIDRAAPVAVRRWDDCVGTVGFAAMRGGSEEEAEGKEERNLGSHCGDGLLLLRCVMSSSAGSSGASVRALVLWDAFHRVLGVVFIADGRCGGRCFRALRHARIIGNACVL
jgi:hypothetical protein